MLHIGLKFTQLLIMSNKFLNTAHDG